MHFYVGDKQGTAKGFGHVLNRIEAQKRLSMTYDQGREMAAHLQLTFDTGVKVYPEGINTSLTRTAPGNAASTRTPTACCGSTYPRAAT